MEHEQEWDGVNRRANTWHVAREIPVAVVITLIIQTMAGVVFFTNLSAKVDTALDTLREFKQERYTRTDAERDRALLLEIIGSMRAQHSDIYKRLESVESKVDDHRAETPRFKAQK
jgi:hypothetical protein